MHLSCNINISQMHIHNPKCFGINQLHFWTYWTPEPFSFLINDEAQASLHCKCSNACPCMCNRNYTDYRSTWSVDPFLSSSPSKKDLETFFFHQEKECAAFSLWSPLSCSLSSSPPPKPPSTTSINQNQTKPHKNAHFPSVSKWPGKNP